MTVSYDLISKKIIKDIKNKILEVSFKEIEIIEFQLEMINSHKERGLVSCEKYTFNENTVLKYDITPYESLTEFISTHEVSRVKIEKILKSVSNLILNCKDLLLDSNNFILDKDFIFIDQAQNNVNLINIPFTDGYNENINETYMKFALDLVKNVLLNSSIKSGDADFFIELKNILTDISLKNNQDINEFIKKIDNAENSSAQINNSFNYSNSNLKTPEQQVTNNPIQQKTIDKNHVNNLKNNNINNQNIQRNTKRNNTVARNKTTEIVEKERYTAGRLILAVIIQPITIAIILSILLFVDSLDITKKLVASVLILALDGILLKMILDKSKKKKVKVKVKKYTDVPNKQNNNLTTDNRSNQVSVDNDSTTFLNADSTTILTEMPCIILKGTDKKEYIESTPYVIGRQAHLSNWMNSKSISRTHAEISEQNGQYFIRDLNSSNGTILNGNKLAGDQSVKLSSGDIISLPGLTLVFDEK